MAALDSVVPAGRKTGVHSYVEHSVRLPYVGLKWIQ